MKNLNILLLYTLVMFLNKVETIDLIEGESPAAELANTILVTKEIKLLAHSINMLDDKVHFNHMNAKIRDGNINNQSLSRRVRNADFQSIDNSAHLDSVKFHVDKAVNKIVEAFMNISWSTGDEDYSYDDDYDDDDNGDNIETMSVTNVKDALSKIEADEDEVFAESPAMADLEVALQKEDGLISALATNDPKQIEQAAKVLIIKFEQEEKNAGAVQAVVLAEKVKLVHDLEDFEEFLEAKESKKGHTIPPLKVIDIPKETASVKQEEDVIIENEDALLAALLSNNKDTLAGVLNNVGTQIKYLSVEDEARIRAKPPGDLRTGQFFDETSEVLSEPEELAKAVEIVEAMHLLEPVEKLVADNLQTLLPSKQPEHDAYHEGQDSYIQHPPPGQDPYGEHPPPVIPGHDPYHPTPEEQNYAAHDSYNQHLPPEQNYVQEHPPAHDSYNQHLPPEQNYVQEHLPVHDNLESMLHQQAHDTYHPTPEEQNYGHEPLSEQNYGHEPLPGRDTYNEDYNHPPADPYVEHPHTTGHHPHQDVLSAEQIHVFEPLSGHDSYQESLAHPTHTVDQDHNHHLPIDSYAVHPDLTGQDYNHPPTDPYVEHPHATDPDPYHEHQHTPDPYEQHHHSYIEEDPYIHHPQHNGEEVAEENVPKIEINELGLAELIVDEQEEDIENVIEAEHSHKHELENAVQTGNTDLLVEALVNEVNNAGIILPSSPSNDLSFMPHNYGVDVNGIGCDCQASSCGCCFNLNLKALEFSSSGCVMVTYHDMNNVELVLKHNGVDVFYKRFSMFEIMPPWGTIQTRNKFTEEPSTQKIHHRSNPLLPKRTFCYSLSLPFPFMPPIDVCGLVHDMSFDDDSSNFNFCLKLNFKLSRKVVVNREFGCMQLPISGAGRMIAAMAKAQKSKLAKSRMLFKRLDSLIHPGY